MKKTITQQLFEAVHNLGEMLHGPLHIIDNTGADQIAGVEITYRVYHKKGYAFDVSRFILNEGVPEDVRQKLITDLLYESSTAELEFEFEYSFFAEWSGFNKIDAAGAYRLIMDYTRMKANHSKTKQS